MTFTNYTTIRSSFSAQINVQYKLRNITQILWVKKSKIFLKYGDKTICLQIDNALLSKNQQFYSPLVSFALLLLLQYTVFKIQTV